MLFMSWKFGHFFTADFTAQPMDQFVDDVVFFDIVFCWSTDDQRCTGFINQNTVHLIDNSKIKPPLNVICQRELHVVTQVVKAEFVICSVRDVTAIVVTATLVTIPMLDQACVHSKESINLPHPVGITTCKVVIWRDHMHAKSGQGVQVNGAG